MVVLLVPLRQDLAARELVEGGEYVCSPQDRPVELDEGLLLLLANNRLADRELGRKGLDKLRVASLVFPFVILVSLVVLIECLEEHQAAGLPVPEQRDSFVRGLLKVPETYDVAEGLHAVKDAICAAVGL